MRRIEAEVDHDRAAAMISADTPRATPARFEAQVEQGEASTGLTSGGAPGGILGSLLG